MDSAQSINLFRVRWRQKSTNSTVSFQEFSKMNSFSHFSCQKISKFAVSIISIVGLSANLGFSDKALAQTPAPQTASLRLGFVGLAPNNTIVRFGLRGVSKTIKATGLKGTLIGIDYRPANGKLYGVTDKNNLYIINPSNGKSWFIKTLTTPFGGGFQSGLDFNPQLDRLRINSVRQNFSVNADDGTATAQTALAYAPGDANAGKDPNVTGAAYSNSVAGATSTKLYNIDYDLDVLVLQDPPNGTLTTVGSLGNNFSPITGFDIFTDKSGRDTAFAASGGFLYTVDLAKGSTKRVRALPNDSLIGLAIIPTGKS
jgi:hypothetical protein